LREELPLAFAHAFAADVWSGTRQVDPLAVPRPSGPPTHYVHCFLYYPPGNAGAVQCLD